MGRRIEQIEKIIRERDVDVAISGGGTTLRMGCNGGQGEWNCVITAEDDTPMLRICAIVPVRVPEYRRAAAAEFINRANWRLVGCRFELNHDDGKVVCESDRFIGEGEIEEESLVWMIDCAFEATDHFLPALMRVIGSDIAPARAMAELDRGCRSSSIASLN
jgi:hypothetical protein